MAKARVLKPKNVVRKYFAFTWDQLFQEEKQRDFDIAQRYIDSEVIKRCAPYTPILTGALYTSPYKKTKIGSGKIVYGVPYDKHQYYNQHFRHSTAIHPFAGAFWFERMKADNVDDILHHVGLITGGRTE